MYNMEHEEALKVWENLRDNEEEKLVYLAKFDGDVEKAKWAFIRDKTKTSSIGNITSTISLPTPILAVLSGQVYFWKLWLLSVLIPNILFKLWLVSPEATSLQNLKTVISIFFLYSMIATCLLIPAFLKLKKEKDKTGFFALIIIVFSLINLAFSIQPILALNSDATVANNQSSKTSSSANSKGELKFANANEKRCAQKIKTHLTSYFSTFSHPTSYAPYGRFNWQLTDIKSNGSRTVDSVLTSWQEIIYVEVDLTGMLFSLPKNSNRNRFFSKEFLVDPRYDLLNLGFQEGVFVNRKIYYECFTDDDMVNFDRSNDLMFNPYVSDERFRSIRDKNGFRRNFSWLFPST